MKKDIEIPIVKDVHVAIVHEWDDQMLNKNWNAYIINNRNTIIEMAIVVSKGYNEIQKTATMRHALGTLEAKSFKKFEPLQEEIFVLNNEFFLTFFADHKLYEKKFLFRKNTINQKNLTPILLINQEGHLAQ
ncbi:MAG: hypothetical protein COA50_08970 [Flavobacteriaceae bacterium]|nr:MAG: hypothetical protein COA50_08970 [Flavobacteriaceae bacterium]